MPALKHGIVMEHPMASLAKFWQWFFWDVFPGLVILCAIWHSGQFEGCNPHKWGGTVGIVTAPGFLFASCIILWNDQLQELAGRRVCFFLSL